MTSKKIDLSEVTEIKTIGNKDREEFDKEVNKLLNGGWALINLYEVPEAVSHYRSYTAQFVKYRKGIIL